MSSELPHWLGGKTACFGTDMSLQWNVILTIEKKLVNLQGLSYMPPNLANFGPEMAENGWQVFALRDTASLTAWALYNIQQANFGTCYVVE